MTMYDPENPQHLEYLARHRANSERAAVRKREGFFYGERRKFGCHVGIDHAEVGKAVLSSRLDLRNHSPDGFEWGYAGSGPAQLALAMCCYATGSDLIGPAVYQRFKDLTIASLPRDEPWSMPVAEVREIAERLYSERQQ